MEPAGARFVRRLFDSLAAFTAVAADKLILRHALPHPAPVPFSSSPRSHFLAIASCTV